MNNIMCIECGVMPCKRGAKKYCSYECSLKNTSVHVLGNSFSIKKGSTPWNKGAKYSKKFKSRLDMSGLEMGRGYFKGKQRLDMRIEKVERILKNCSHCGKQLRLIPYQVTGRKRNFCNRTCWALGTRGEGSPVYKGDKAIARLRNRIAQLPEYRKWHAEIMKRDNYRCTICNCVHSKERPLEVDHIKRFLTIANEYEIITPEDARNCKELWDTKNGRTVCRICHRTLDTYGTKGLTKLST